MTKPYSVPIKLSQWTESIWTRIQHPGKEVYRFTLSKGGAKVIVTIWRAIRTNNWFWRWSHADRFSDAHASHGDSLGAADAARRAVQRNFGT